MADLGGEPPVLHTGVLTTVSSDPIGNPVLLQWELHTVFAEDEGVTWIRGRHTRDTPDGQALLAAYALVHTA